MDYFPGLDIISAYLAGALTIVLIFHKKFLDDGFSFDSDQKTNRELNKLEVKFYDLLLSTVDLSLYKNTIEAIELERQRIGIDIHDELATHLSSLNLDLEVIGRESHLLSDQASALLSQMRHKVKNTVVLLRKIIHEILPPTLEDGNITEAINDLCNKHEGRKGTSILFRVLGTPSPLSKLQNAYLYRIMQELLTNCFKHSLAWTIFVTVTWSKKELVVSVKDTGIGMPKFVEQADKFGVGGIFVRTEIMGATAKFKTPTKGTEFELRLVLDKKDSG